jgi:CO/xanthine dehydrogenase Mo-binding subunit
MIIKDKKEYKVIGTRPIRHDGLEKVTGRALYSADVKLPQLQIGTFLRSPYAHAKIISIDTVDAEKHPGVTAVVTGEDFEVGENKEIEIGEGIANFKFDSMNIMAKDKVLYKGHAVAAVCASDLNTAEEAIKKIKVKYEELEPVLSVNEAISQSATILHEDFVGTTPEGSKKNTNIADYFNYEIGDPDKGFNESDQVIERVFTMPMVHQGYIELHSATVVWGEDGRLTIWTSTQGAFPVRTQTAELLGIPESMIRVMPTEIGGGFGGKTRVYLPPVAAVLSKKSNRPVKLTMDRQSVFEGTGPAPGGKVTIKIGVNKNMKLNAASADIKFEAGAFPGSAVGAAAICVFSCYDIPNTRIDGYDILVNKPKSAAYRAPGSPQASFGMDATIDEICSENGWDPLEFRIFNASKEGSRRADGPKFPKIGNLDVLDAVKNSDHWNTPIENGTSNNGRLKGRGIASGYWMNGGGKSSVTLNVNDDGTVSLLEGSADIGGTRSSIAMHAAEVLGLKAEDIIPRIPDTDGVGYTGMTGGSRTTYATGFAAYHAAESLIEKLTSRVAILWDISEKDVEFLNSIFQSKKDPELKISFKELAGKLDSTGGPVSSVGSVNLSSSSHGYATHIVDLEIDPKTGKTDVSRYTTIQDVGKAIHPSYVEGQMQGGAAQGIGWALNEEYYISDNGKMENSSFLDYRMPTSLDLPMIETIIVENENRDHPFGVRGVGEVPIVPPLAAVANAIHDALGIRLYDLPMKPEKIVKELKSKNK